MNGAAHDRLTELFTEALGLSTIARAQLIERVRTDDAPLAAELSALLAADAMGATELGTGALGGHPDLEAAADATVQARPGAASRPSGPSIVGAPTIPGFRIVDVLGTGGMGTVFAAEQQAPRRLVAIKVLHARSRGALARFWTESEIMARLDHPGIARVLEAGLADSEPYLVMERVDGTTLDELARTQTLTLSRRVELIGAVCEAVHHAHVNGVIHRDLKPSNVMVRADGRITVLDFGIARVVGDDGSTPGDTRAGELIGTPIYMSPEQARLRPDAVDARSDVYTLGVMLYELAAGELPYPARGLALPELTRAICETPPRSLGRGDPALRGDLDAITQKALAKDPKDRYQSAAALAEDVRAYLAGMPVSARTPGTAEQLVRFVRRRPWLAAAIGGALVAAMAFAAVVTVLWVEASHQRTRAEHARDALAARTDQLVLREARTALARDPTEAVTWLASLTGHSLDPEAAWSIADEAVGRGIASDVLRAHADEIHWVEPVPGGGFVSGGYDGRVLVWSDPPTLHPRELWRGKGRIHTVRPSPDGKRFAIGGDDGALDILAADGKHLASLGGHAGDVQRIEWARDGSWLLTADDHGGAYAWPGGASPGRKLAGATSSLSALAIGSDGAALGGERKGTVWRWPRDPAQPVQSVALGASIVGVWGTADELAAADADGNVVRWRVDPLAGLVETARTASGQKSKHAVFAHGGAWVLLAGIGGTVVRVEGATIEVPAIHRAQVRCLAISDDGRRIASGSDDGAVQVLDRATGRRRVLRGHRERVRHVAFARGGDELISSDGDGIVRRWDLAGTPPTVFAEPGAVIERFAASPDGARVAVVDETGALAVWTVADGGVRRLGILAGHASAIAFAGDTVVTGTVDGQATWWPAGGARPVAREVKGVISAIAVSRDGARVAVASTAGPIGLFTAAGESLGALPGNAGGTEAIAFDKAGDLLASGGQDRVVRVWRVADRSQIAELDGPHGDTHFVAFSPSGDRLVSAANDGAVRAWTMKDGAPGDGRILASHTGAVTAIAFDPSGTWLVSAGRDRTVARTPLAGGASVATPLSSPAVALVLAPDGALRAVTSAGTVERWPADGGPVVPIGTGARTAASLGSSEDRWIVALADGALAIESLHARPLAELSAVLGKTTAHL